TWARLGIVDVRTGATFNVADFAGKVIFVESMATWCPPCLEQQRQMQAALVGLDPTRIAFVSLDVDPRESLETLRRYADRYGFSWTFALGSPQFLRELAADFGEQVLNPPATPLVVIATDGSASLTEFGIKGATRLAELARTAGG